MRGLLGGRVGASTLVALAAIVSVPLLFAVATRGEWLVDYGSEDNWIYVKYFDVWGNPHPELRRAMDDNYKAARVPWILPGYVAYQVFGPLVGTYVLHLTVLIGGTLCFWAAARRLFGEGTALIASLLLIAYPNYHSSTIPGFWNYHGQASLAYYFLATLCLTFGVTARWPLLWYAGTGAALVGSLGTSLTYVVLLPSLAVFALALLGHARGRIELRQVALMLGGGLLGAFAAIGLFGAANVLVSGGPFLFFWRQITYTVEVAADAPPFRSLGEWFPAWFEHARWIGYPPLVVLAALAALWPVWRSNRLRGQRWAVLGCLLQVLVACVTVVVLELRAQPMIQVAYIYHQILAPTAFALAALIFVIQRGERRLPPILGIVILIVGLILPQLLLTEPQRGWLRDSLDLSQVLPVPPSQLWSVLLVLAIGGALLAAALRTRRTLVLGLASVVLGVGFAISVLEASQYLPPNACSYFTSQYRVVLRAVQWSNDERIDTRALIWFDPAEQRTIGPDCPPIRMFPIFDAIQHGTTIRLAANPVPPRLPEAPTDLLATAIRNRWSMVLLSTPEAEAEAEAAFRAWLARSPVEGVARPRERFEAADGHIAVVMQVFELRRP